MTGTREVGGPEAQRAPWRGPDGLTVHDRRAGETDALYREIFVERGYAPAGMRVPSGSVVVDVGANIGMFSLFAVREWPGSPIVAIEAVPELADLCRRNLLTAPDARVLSVACTDADGSTEMVYYPEYSILSGRHAEPSADARTTGQLLKAAGRLPEDVSEEDLVELIELKMRDAVRIQVPGRMLDSLLAAVADRPIGLVKIDVEGDELAVLAGAGATLERAAHVIVEADGEPRGADVAAVLEDAGFRVQRYQSAEYVGSSLQLVWGAREA